MKIEVLYPEICNLYGELTNVRYLARCIRGAEITETHLKGTPLFASEKPALVYMGAMSERSQELVTDALRPYTEHIKQRIDDGTVFLITGNAMEIFGDHIENEDGSRTECLKLFGTYAVRRMMDRYNSLYLGRFGDTDIVGFKSQFSHSYGDSGTEPLFRTVRGAGSNPGTEGEGIRKNNFMATYVIGPLLILNPDFTKALMRLMGSDDRLLFEPEIYDVYRKRLSEFRDPKTGFIYY